MANGLPLFLGREIRWRVRVRLTKTPQSEIGVCVGYEKLTGNFPSLRPVRLVSSTSRLSPKSLSNVVGCNKTRLVTGLTSKRSSSNKSDVKLQCDSKLLLTRVHGSRRRGRDELSNGGQEGNPKGDPLLRTNQEGLTADSSLLLKKTTSFQSWIAGQIIWDGKIKR